MRTWPQMRAAGFVEGFLTARQIHHHHHNVAAQLALASEAPVDWCALTTPATAACRLLLQPTCCCRCLLLPPAAAAVAAGVNEALLEVGWGRGPAAQPRCCRGCVQHAALLLLSLSACPHPCALLLPPQPAAQGALPAGVAFRFRLLLLLRLARLPAATPHAGW